MRHNGRQLVVRDRQRTDRDKQKEAERKKNRNRQCNSDRYYKLKTELDRESKRGLNFTGDG